MDAKITLPALQQMKDDGRKIVGVVAWDYQIAQIVDRAGVDIVSVGDTVGMNLWGQPNPFEVTMDQMVVVSQAVRRGVTRALAQLRLPVRARCRRAGTSAVRAAIRLVKEAGVDMVKLDGAADFLERCVAVDPRRHPGVRPVRDHPADGAAATASSTTHRPRPTPGAGRDARPAGGRGQAAGGRPAPRC